MAGLVPDPFPAPPDPVWFPNTRRRVSASHTTGAARASPPDMPPAAADPDTCRICRAEGSPDEPLFYPCKCSGSIKYVHQDCLMEWLSHSQKKHCELCKTPFRFTKLYDPNMPKSLPAHVFVSHTARYLLRNLLVWLRAALVANVWLVWLPYLMRSVWSFLFWISDEGLGGQPAARPENGLGLPSGAMHGAGVCPSSPLFAATTTVAAIGGILENLPPASAKLVQGLYGVNLTSSDPIYATVLRLLFGTVGLAENPAAADAAPWQTPAEPNQETLLSGVTFLRNLTRHPSINRAVIAVLEGQIITVLVIVCFILIILVRDYVVQQQPEINMRAAFAALENAPPPPVVEAAQEPVQDEAGAEDLVAAAEEAADNEAAIAPSGEAVDDGAAESSGRPTESSDLLPPARPGHMQDSDRATVHEYLDIYREAGGDPERILQIARERQLETKLDYWMRLTRSRLDRQRATEEGDLERLDPSDDVPASSEEPGEGDPSAKGKGRLEDDVPLASPMRPRANTDGPPAPNTIHPLANNSWSFADLPPAAAAPEPLSSTPAPDYSTLLRETPAESSTSAAPTGPPSVPSTPVDDDWQALGPEPETASDHDPTEQGELPEVHGPRAAPAEPAGLVDRVADLVWRDVDNIPVADLAPINALGDFFGEPDEADLQNAPADEVARDREAAEDRAAGLDAEAIEDAEDLEGILELLGMRGPVAGLFQNAIFCAFLVSLSIFVGVFMPYNLGRFTIWAVANPLRLARMLFGLSKFVQDCCLLALGLAASTASESAHMLCRALALPSVADYWLGWATALWAMAAGAAQRIGGSVVTELPIISASEMRNFSAISHAALLAVKEHCALGFTAAWRLLSCLLGGPDTGASGLSALAGVPVAVWQSLKDLPAMVVNPGSWVLNLSLPEPAAGVIDPDLAYWGGADRFWAILAGYASMALSAGLYLRRGAPLSTTQAAREWEASLIDGLHQASGVVKVILIISIEMLVFPLYCGMLLDVALLPLFEGATLRSRLFFTFSYPITSVFVHWFVGTGYMFHFALFVSMCRKIMRKGVLYFIRDPDDPEFHPVRDVLERNVATQLRKILFSAFVYGALVIVCLGGVVWGLAAALPGVLPIHYSSNEPVLEFPLDLLFYNFLMPLAVAFFRPSDGLHAMYTWWFRRCARALRITWFLLGERRVDEEGRLVLAADSPDRALPFWRRLFLEVDDVSGRVVARTWRNILEGGTVARGTAKKDHVALCSARKRGLVRSGQLVPDGRFVRAPASDQVKIPKGGAVFLEVTEDNTRLDGVPDRPVTDMYSSTNQYQLVYVPPHFRLRVFLFILSIWIFAAVTGVSITVLPLIFGRWMFRQLIPRHIRTNDVYAFSIGIHILGAAAYALLRAPSVYASVRDKLSLAEATLRGDAARRASAAVARAARVVYTYVFVLVVVPLLLVSLMELYALIPLHEVMYSALLRPGGASPTAGAANPAHTVRVVQAWTIGLLYLKLGTRITNTWFEGSRVSNAARAVLRNGWLDPDVTILTRCFVVPGLALWLAAVATPLLLARWAVAQGLADALVRGLGSGDRALRDACLVLVYRLSFPLVALGAAAGLGLWSMVGVFRGWQARIRDEAYLIGERLHNFGGPAAPRTRDAWTAGARM